MTAACAAEIGVGLVAIVWLIALAPALQTEARRLPDPDTLIAQWNAPADEAETEPMAWLDREVPDLTEYAAAGMLLPEAEDVWEEWSRRDGEDVLHWTRLGWVARDLDDPDLYVFCRRQVWRCRKRWEFQ